MKQYFSFLLLSLYFYSGALLALQTTQAIESRIRTNIRLSDPRQQAYMKTQYGSNHIRFGYNTLTPTAIFDVVNPTTTEPSLRMVYGPSTDYPSFTHYQSPGHWIIQSGTNTGIVYMQPRGGSVQIGSPDTGTSTEYHKKLNAAHTTTFNIYAENTYLYKTVLVHNPANALAPSYNLYETLTRVPASNTSIEASEFIDINNETFRMDPSGNSVINTIAVSSLIDRQRSNQNTTYSLDLNGQSNLNDLEVLGILKFTDVGSKLDFPSAERIFSIKVNNTDRTLDFESDDPNPAISPIQFNRPIAFKALGPKKIDLTNLGSGSEIHGIYILGKPALTADTSGSGSLYINSRNGFNFVKVGVSANTTALLDIAGTMRATVEFIGYGTIPVGGIIMWSGTAIPDGWALCDGRTAYGKTTPNLVDKFIVGASKYANDTTISSLPSSPFYRIGETGGANAVTLTLAQIPSHTHKLYDNYNQYTEDTDASGSGQGEAGWHTSGWEDTGYTGGLNGTTQPHENRPPYYALAYIMRVR